VLVLIAGELTEQVIGLAIEVHRHTGPGLLESVYEQCLCHELREARIEFERQVAIPVIYKAMSIGEGFRADIVVAREVILEIKSVAAILPAHEAQLHTYLRMSGLRIGLILNFNSRRLTEGIRRYVV
jgi:GxxExxY protein